jgi:predicted TPR repeat methyltransferase
VPTSPDLTVIFPSIPEGRLSQDEEWCRVLVDGEERTIRFHDYHEIYAIPGLYERIFYEHLKCRSPAEVVGLLGEEMRSAGEDPADLSVLDVGAGNGIVGDELRDLGARALVGVDIIPEAAEAAARDRPGVYDDYVVCDLTAMGDDERERLRAEPPNCLTTVAALGFDDLPPDAFTEAYGLIADDGWVAFNIKADFLEGDDSTGFRRLITRMIESSELDVRARRRYCHRLSMQRDPLDYVALVGRKRSPAGRRSGAT